MGGRFGQMSTLMNYYDLISNISAEEYGHIELVAATINGMLTGASDASQVDGQVGLPLKDAKDKRLSHHFIVSGQRALAANSLGQGDYVFCIGRCTASARTTIATSTRSGRGRTPATARRSRSPTGRPKGPPRRTRPSSPGSACPATTSASSPRWRSG